MNQTINKKKKKTDYRKFINTDELVFDFAIFIVFLIFDFFRPKNSLFIDSLNQVVLFFMLFLTVFFSPMYLSSINTRFKNNKNDLISRIISPFSMIITMLTSVFIVYAMPCFLIEYYNSNFFIAFFFINLFFGIIALIIGWHIGHKYETDQDDSSKLSIGIFTYLAPMIVIIPVFSVALIYEYSGSWTTSLLLGLLIFMFSSYFIGHGNAKLDSFFKSSVARNYVFPFFMAFMLTFAHELINEVFVYEDNNKTTQEIFMSLMLSGILPTRIILLLSPPRKIINIIITLGSLGLLFYNLFVS